MVGPVEVRFEKQRRRSELLSYRTRHKSYWVRFRLEDLTSLLILSEKDCGKSDPNYQTSQIEQVSLSI